jgi:hypothetical protein
MSVMTRGDGYRGQFDIAFRNFGECPSYENFQYNSHNFGILLTVKDVQLGNLNLGKSTYFEINFNFLLPELRSV